MHASNPNPQSRPIGSMTLLACRVTWFLFGPIAMMALAYGIVSNGSGWLTTLDLAFLIVVAVMIGARQAELRAGTAQTATGEPATAAHVGRYTRMLLLFAAAVWVVTNVVGNHLIG
jgi:hypothetical protein